MHLPLSRRCRVQDKNGVFVPAVPVPNTVGELQEGLLYLILLADNHYPQVVNIGDLLQRWSNEVLKSTIHRVVLPVGDDRAPTTPQRNSIAFFSNPNLHQMIECLPNTGSPKYEPVECEQYLIGRLSATYA